MRPLGLALVVVGAVVGCGGGEPDARALLVQLSDLPPGYRLVPGETLPTAAANVLADPWAKGHEALIRRQRVAGYQTSFWSPGGRRIECGVAVYRSSEGAAEVVRLRGGLPAERLGDEKRAFRFELGELRGLALTWRHGNVLATCTSVGVEPDAAQLRRVALAQQRRIAQALAAVE